MTEDKERENDEKYLIKDLQARFNNILTQDLSRLIKFNSACVMAINYFRKGKTINEFEENINSFSEIKLTKEALKTLYNEAAKQKDVKAEEIKFFRLYVDKAVMDFTASDQTMIKEIVKQQK